LLAISLYKKSHNSFPYAMVLGVTQDAGYPQMNCKKECCKQAWEDPELKKLLLA
jgi:pyrroloquinoline quinone biosynthesis protein B